MAEEERSPEEIERELDLTRARMDETLDAIQQKLSPAELLDEGWAYFRDSGGPRYLARAVRDNPLAVVVIGLGVFWLLLSGSRKRRSTYVESTDYTVTYAPDEALPQSEPFDENIAPEALDRSAAVPPPVTGPVTDRPTVIGATGSPTDHSVTVEEGAPDTGPERRAAASGVRPAAGTFPGSGI